MTKKKVTKQSVRQSAVRKKEEKQQRRRSIALYVAVGAVVIVLLAGLAYLITRPGGEPSILEGFTLMAPESRPLAEIEPALRNGYYETRPDTVIDPNRQYQAIVRTEKGDMRLRLFVDEAPLTVNNFVFLANEGFYNDTVFHRVIEDFMAQGGDPTGTGTGGPGYAFEDETDNDLSFNRAGLLAMANSGPNTNGSQFFITFGPATHLDGLHTIFGEVVEGEDVLNSITFVQPGASTAGELAGDRIISVDILESDN